MGALDRPPFVRPIAWEQNPCVLRLATVRHAFRWVRSVLIVSPSGPGLARTDDAREYLEP